MAAVPFSSPVTNNAPKAAEAAAPAPHRWAMVARQRGLERRWLRHPSQTQGTCRWAQAEPGSTATLAPPHSWPFPKWQEILSKLLLGF